MWMLGPRARSGSCALADKSDVPDGLAPLWLFLSGHAQGGAWPILNCARVWTRCRHGLRGPGGRMSAWRIWRSAERQGLPGPIRPAEDGLAAEAGIAGTRQPAADGQAQAQRRGGCAASEAHDADRGGDCHARVCGRNGRDDGGGSQAPPSPPRHLPEVPCNLGSASRLARNMALWTSRQQRTAAL